jgi:outer membrane protein assembly factor BamB
MKRAAVLTSATCLLLASLAVADDWPQWQGPNRDNISKETGLLKNWPEGGPPLLWTFSNAGLGYSSPAVVGDRLYLTGARADGEYVFALDLKVAPGSPAKELWAVKVGKTFTFKGNAWGEGPRISPTVAGDLLFALGGYGDLVCVEAGTGKEKWRKNLPQDLGAEVNPIGGGPEKLGWGFSWAPLVDGDRLVCFPGGPQGTLAALDKNSGSVLWRSTEVTDQASYSSPIAAEVDGVRQYLVMTNEWVLGVDAKTGKLLWKYQRHFDDVAIPTPIFRDGHVYVTTGPPGNGNCDLIKLTRDGDHFKADKVYANKVMRNGQGGVVLVGDYLYGFSQRYWTCQDFKTGEAKWEDKSKKLGAGSLTCAEGMLYCYGEEDGTVVLVEASPEKWTEKGRFQIPQQTTHRAPNGKIWTHPVVAHGKLYLRDQDLLFCYDIKGK